MLGSLIGTIWMIILTLRISMIKKTPSDSSCVKLKSGK